MNYTNPYMYYFPYATMPMARTGLFSGLSGLFKGGINWGSILTNTQKTLGLINQAIPAIKQVSPVVKNAKTMFRLMSEFKKVDTPASTYKTVNNNSSTNKEVNVNPSSDKISSDKVTPLSPSSGPTFFI